jgi:large repetitive protein
LSKYTNSLLLKLHEKDFIHLYAFSEANFKKVQQNLKQCIKKKNSFSVEEPSLNQAILNNKSGSTSVSLIQLYTYQHTMHTRIQHSFSFKPITLLALLILCGLTTVTAQTPGQIYQPATNLGIQVMDPNEDGFVSKDRLGFPNNGTADGAGNMELSMIRVPYFSPDPVGDLATGSAGSQLDFVGSQDDNGTVYVVNRTVEGIDYLMVRLRLGKNASAGKAWGLLIDTDGQIQFSGRNPGFEKEVLLVTGSGGGVQVNTLTPGTTTVVASLFRLTPLSDYHQRALAADGNVFYDYYVPLSELGITTSTPLRFVAVTVTNGTSAIAGTVADVSGVDDKLYGNNIGAMLKALGQASPVVSLSNLGGLEGPQTTVAPVVNGPITTASTSISGTSVEANGTSIEVFRDGVSIGTTTVTANAWSLSPLSLGGTPLAVNQVITAKALADGKTLSSVSNSISVTPVAACFVAAPEITGRTNGNQNLTVSWTASSSGVGISSTATVRLLRQGTPGTFSFTQLGSDATVTSGSNVVINTGLTQSDFSNAAIYAQAEVAGCLSSLSAGDVDKAILTVAPTITDSQIIASSTESRTITVRNNHAGSATIFLYRNGQVVGTGVSGIAQNGTTTFTLTSPVVNERITARAMAATTAFLSNESNAIIVNSGASQTTSSPVIVGSYTSGSSKTVSGTSDEAAGTQVVLRKTVSSTTTVLGSTTVNAFGNWSVTGLTLATGDVLTAVALADGKLVSAASNSVTVAAGVPAAPTITTTPIVANQTTSISGTAPVSGTITVYVDGSPLGTTTGTSWTLSGITASEFSRGAIVTATNTVSGIESPLSNAVTVTGVANFQITLNGSAATSVVAGDPFTATITARDGSNNTFTSFNGYVTLTSTSAIGTGGGRIGPFENGVLLNHSLSLLTAGNNQSITVVNPDDPTAFGSATVGVVNPGAPFQLVFLGNDPTGSIQAGESLGNVRVQVQDEYANNRADNNITVLLSLEDSPANTISEVDLKGTTSVVTSSGIATYSGINVETLGTYRLKATSTSLDQAIAGNSGSFTITAGDASQYVVTASKTNPDISETITISAQLSDAFGNAVATSGRQVNWTSTNGGSFSLASSLTNASGIATISFTAAASAGTSHVVTATDNADGTIKGDSPIITTQAGAPTKLVLNSPADITTDQRAEYTVTRQDAGSNPTSPNQALTVYLFSTGTSGAFYAASSGGSAINSVTIPAGQSSATFYFTATTVGTYTITASDATPADGENGLADATDEIVVNAGAASKLLVTAPDSSPIANPQLRNLPFDVRVTLTDASGNAVLNTEEIIITLTGVMDNPAQLNAISGILKFAFDDKETPDPVTVTLPAGSSSALVEKILYSGLSGDDGGDVKIVAEASDSGTSNAVGKTGESNKFSVRGIVLTIAADPTSITADGTSTSDITVTLTDGNTPAIPQPGQTIRLTTNLGTFVDGSNSPTEITLVTDAEGQVTIPLLSTTQTGTATVTAICPGACNVTTDVAFVAGAASRLAFGTQPSNAVAGAAIDPAITVQITDDNGNIVTTASNTVYLSIGTNPSSGTLSDTRQIDAVNGVATFNNISINNPGVGYTLVASDEDPADNNTGLSNAVSDAFNITVGELASFEIKNTFGNDIGTQTAGTAFNVRIRALDGSGNVVPSFNGTVTLTSTGALSGTPLTSGTFVNGVLAEQAVTITNTGTGFTLSASDGGTPTPITGNSNAFNVNAGAVASFEIKNTSGNDIGTQTAGTAFNVRIRALDGSGNVATGFTGTVTLTSTGTLSESITTAAFTAGELASQAVTITNTGNFTLSASDGGDPAKTGISNAFNVVAGAVASFEIKDTDGNDIGTQTAGTAFEVRIRALDANGNVVPSFGNGLKLTSTGVLTGSPVTLRRLKRDEEVLERRQLLTITNTGTGFTLTVIDSVDSEITGTSNAFDVVAGAATQIAINEPDNSNNQSAAVGTSVSTAPSVIVRDANNNPVTGVSVTFAVASGGGTVDPTTAVETDENGIASVTSWTLGATPGTNTLTATITGSEPAVSTTFTATGYTAPQAPVITSLTAGYQQITVAFTAPGDNGGIPITNYEYNLNNSDTWVPFSPASTTSPFTITGLTNDETYIIQLRAVNEVINGIASDTMSATPRNVTVTIIELDRRSFVESEFDGTTKFIQNTVTFPNGPGLFDGPGFNASFGQGDVIVTRFVPPAGSYFAVKKHPDATNQLFNLNGVWQGGSGSTSNFPTPTITFEGLTGTAPTITYRLTGLSDNGNSFGVQFQSDVTADFTFTAIEISFPVTHNPARTNTAYGSVTSGSAPSFGVTAIGAEDLEDMVLFAIIGEADQLAFTSSTENLTSGTSRQLTVEIRDESGNRIITDTGTVVTFSKKNGDGTVSSLGTATTTSGIATLDVTGVSAGEITIEATTGELTPATTTFTIIPGEATKLAINDGDNQSTTVGSVVSTTPSVLVTDANDNPVEGVEVTFAVASGGGTVDPTTTVETDENGIASVTSWTLGATPGTNTLTATSGSLSGSPLTFTATATAGSADRLVITSVSPTSPINGVPRTTVTVQLQDAFGNPVNAISDTPVLLTSNKTFQQLTGETSNSPAVETPGGTILAGQSTLVIDFIRFTQSSRTVTDGGVVTYPADATFTVTDDNNPHVITGFTTEPFVVTDGTLWRAVTTGTTSRLLSNNTNTGNWNGVNWETSTDGGSNWTPVLAGSVPTTFGPEEIIGIPGGGITIVMDSDVSLHNMIVNSTLEIPTGLTLTLKQTAGDLNPDGIEVRGALRNSGGTFVNEDETKPIRFNGGTYIHARDGGSIPVANWVTRPGETPSISAVRVTGIDGSSLAKGLDQAFEQLIWDNGGQVTDQTLHGNMSVSTLLDIKGGKISIGNNTLSIAGTVQHGSDGWLHGSEDSELEITASGSIQFGEDTSEHMLRSLTLNSAGGLTLNSDLNVVNSLTLTAGELTVSGSNELNYSGGNAIDRTSGFVVGNLRRTFPSTVSAPSFTYPIGTAGAYAPVTLAFSAGSITEGTGILASTIVQVGSGVGNRQGGSGFKSDKQASRYWSLVPDATLSDITYGVTLNVPDAELTGLTFNALAVRKLSETGGNGPGSKQWKAPTGSSGSQSGGFGSLTANGFTDFSEFYVGEREAASIVLTGPNPATVTAGSASADITLTVVDELGEAVAVGQNTAFTLSSADESATAVFGGTAVSESGGVYTLTVPSGSSSATFTYTNTKVGDGTHTLSATWSSGGVDLGADTVDIGVEVGDATKFVVTGSGTQTAGDSQTITITAYDANGNVSTGYTGSKSLTFSGANAAPDATNPTVSSTDFGTATSISFTSGVATASMTLYKTETAVVSVTDGSISSTDTDRLSVVVSAANASLTTSLISAVPGTITTSTTSDGKVSFSTTGTVQISQTEPLFGLTGTQPVTLSFTYDPTKNTNTNAFVQGSSIGTYTAQNPFYGYDKEGVENLQITLGGTAIATGGLSFQDFIIEVGVGADIWMDTDITQDTPSLIAFRLDGGMDSPSIQIGSIASSSTDILMQPQLGIQTMDGGSASGTYGTINRSTSGFSLVTVQLRDAYDNDLQSSGGTVTLSTNLGNLTSVTDNTDGTYKARFNSPTVGVATISGALDLQSLTNTATINVEAGAATQLSLTTQPSTTAASGTAFAQQPVIQLQDAQGNAVAQAGVVVTASIASGEQTLGGTATATTDANGVATFTDLSITGTIGVRTLDFTATGLTTVTSGNIDITAGEAAQLVSMSVDDAFIKLDGSTSVSVTVLDANDNPVEGVEVSFTSDETDRATVSVSATTDESGVATATITGASDQQGEVTITASITSDDDNVAESVSETATLTVLGPPALTVNDLTTKDTTPTITGTSDLIGGTVTVTINDIEYTAIVAEDGTWSVDVTAALDEGEYEITASITDAAGNTTTETGTLTIDTTAPVLAVNDLTTKDTTPTITGTSDLIGGTVTVTINDIEYTAIVAEDGTWSVDVTAALDEGEYEITASITDAAGNTTTETGTLTIDTTAPVLAVNDLTTKDTTPTITGTSDLIGGTVTVTINDIEYTAIVAEDGTWSVDVTAALDEGEYEITASITDAAGNTTTETGTLTIDTTAPVLAVNDLTTKDTTPTITGTSDLIGGTVTVTINDIEYTAIVAEDGTWSVDVTAALDEGEYEITASITDAAGNTTTETGTLTIDTTAPVLAVNDLTTKDTTPTITGTSDLIGGTVTVTINDIEYTAIVAEDGTWSVDVTAALDEGEYEITASITDAAGNTTTETGTLTIDTTAPVLAVNDLTTKDTTPTITGTSDLIGGTVTVTINDIEYTAIVAEDGTWSVDVTAALDEGEYEITASITDAAGNTTTETGTLTIDTTAPALTVNDLTTKDTTPTITGTSDLIGGTVTVTINDIEYTAIVAEDGTWSVDVTAALDEGEYEITASITDAAGNTTTETGTLTIDTTAPVLAVNDLTTKDTTPTITGTSDLIGGTVTVTINDIEYTAIVAEDGTWSVDVTAALDEGEYEITASITDAAGNTTTETGTLTIDTTAPVLAVNDLTTKDTTPTITGTSDLIGGTVTVTINDIEYTAIVAEDGTWSVDVTAALDEGEYEITASITDAAGNTTTETGTLTIDTTAPVLAVNDLTTKDTTPTITGTSDLIGGTVTVTINDIEYTAIVAEDGTWSVDVTAALDEGEYEITASITDAAGNTTTETGTLTIDTTAPVLAVNDLTTKDTTPTITGTSDLIGGTVTVTINDIEYTAIVAEDGTWSVDVTAALDEGEYEITASITDAAGNTTTETGTLTIDTTAPVLAVNDLTTKDTTPTITGTSDLIGGTVTVTINDIEYTAIVAEDGTWSVDVTAALDEGEYEITASITDAAGNTTTETGTLTIDTTAPVLAVNDLTTKDTTPTITGTSDLIGGTVTVTINDIEYTAIVAEDGTWSVDVTAALDEGEYEITASITDAAGNTTTETGTLTIDTTAPVLAVNDLTTKDTTPTITGTSDLIGGTVTVTINDIEYTAIVAEDGTWSVDVTAALDEGEYEITASITDAAGNTTTETGTLTIDTTAPVLAVNDLTTNDTTPTITGTSDLIGGTVTVTINDIEYTAIVAEDGTWSVDVTAALDEGEYEITASITDAAGNTTTETGTLTIDTTAPVLAVNDLTTKDTTPTITGTSDLIRRHGDGNDQ